jgi:hypothetical protein
MDTGQEVFGKQLVKRMLLDNYQPAGPGENAREMTTAEMFDVLATHAPKMFDARDVYMALQENGYQTVRFGDELRWLILPR